MRIQSVLVERIYVLRTQLRNNTPTLPPLRNAPLGYRATLIEDPPIDRTSKYY